MGHTRKALRALSNGGQHTAHRVLCMWWTTGWCHRIANSEYSTCLSVFWRNKRDGGNSCEGRERGGSQDITQGLCLSCPTHSSHIHQSKHVNMHTDRHICTHMQTRAKFFKGWIFKNTTVLAVQQMERGERKTTRNMSRMSTETVMTKFLPAPGVSLLFSQCFCSQDARRSILPREAETIYALNTPVLDIND